MPNYDPSTGTGDASARMDAFYDDLKHKNMDALWRVRVPGQSGAEPLPQYPPCRWEWSDIRPFMTRAGELVTPGPDAERRVVLLLHPGLPAARAASQLLTANVQMVLPGEVAPPHRHTIAAIRFVIEGESAITTVDGEPVEMHPGDLVLTPALHWHGHENRSSGPTLWMDTLDRPLTVGLGQSRFEQYPAGAQPLSRSAGDSSVRNGTGLLKPVNVSPSKVSPVISYPWTQSRTMLLHLAEISESDPFDDVAMDYTNPLNGGPVLPTIGCRIQMVRSGVHTRSHRHAYTSVYHVFRGRGSSIVDGVRVAWKANDFLTIPPYSWHEHHNDDDAPAVLFSVTDAPVIDALGFSREDAYVHSKDGHQPIVATYEDRYAVLLSAAGGTPMR